MPGPGAAAAALLPAVLLAALAPWAGRGAAAPAAPNGTLEAALERRWESLVARSLARLPAAAQPPEAAVQSGAGDYLLGIKRLRRLYCNVGIGFHLQVLRDGRIGGVHADTGDSEWGGGPGPQRCPRPRAGTCSPADPGSGACGAGTRGRKRRAASAAAGTSRAHSPRPARPRLPALGSLRSGCRIPSPSPVGTGRAAQPRAPQGARDSRPGWGLARGGPEQRNRSPSPAHPGLFPAPENPGPFTPAPGMGVLGPRGQRAPFPR